MTTSSIRRRSAGKRSHVADHRQRQDAILTERRAREDTLIEKHDRARKEVQKFEARRDKDLADLREQVRSVRDTAAGQIAEAKKEIVAAVTELKQDHTAEEAAPLLNLTVEQFNKILYSGRVRNEPPQAGGIEPRPITDAGTSDAATETPSPPLPDERPPPQIALFPQSDEPPQSSSTATPAQPRLFAASTSDGTGSAPPSTEPRTT